jgi:hypothetical protein
VPYIFFVLFSSELGVLFVLEHNCRCGAAKLALKGLFIVTRVFRLDATKPRGRVALGAHRMDDLVGVSNVLC